jgi:hypothetical protein
MMGRCFRRDDLEPTQIAIMSRRNKDRQSEVHVGLTRLAYMLEGVADVRDRFTVGWKNDRD